MPRISEKQKLLKLLEEIALNDLLILELFCEDDEDKRKREEEVLDELLMVLAIGEGCRYSVPFIQNSVPKSKYFLQDVLWNMDENRFKKFTRVNWNTFNVLINLIKHDEVFTSNKSCKQFPVETQLAIVLYRLGASGEGATISKMAGLFRVSDGGTIQNITARVFDALLKHKEKYICWPNSDERKMIVSETWMELPNCIGYVDGTEIPLAEQPSEDPVAYFSRKRHYSVKVQAICDFRLQIRHLVLGYPGSVHDARIFNNCQLSTESDKFFGCGEWIAGDSAYKLTKNVITPFRDNSRDMTESNRTFFNRTFSSYRVRIEHCFGMLKERFNSLKSLRIQIKNENDIRKVNKWILCTAILHNIILQQNDTFEHELDESDMDTNDTNNNSTFNLGQSEGERVRRTICEMLLAMNPQ